MPHSYYGTHQFRYVGRLGSTFLGDTYYPERVAAIYQITNINTGDMYIGSAKDARKRFLRHGVFLRNNGSSRALQNAFNQGDILVFQCIELVDDVKLLGEREKHYIDTWKPAYNKRITGKVRAGYCDDFFDQPDRT
jgi:group I intron endonuclease